MRIEYQKYPICDTDMWINICLAGFCDRVFEKYNKIIFADVVEQEILRWEIHEDKFKVIVDNFCARKKSGEIYVINHYIDFDESERLILETMLSNLNFKTGLMNDPKEDNKGEFVSAIYADHLNIPFMKTNDNIFNLGERGNREFPDLKIKKWSELSEELSNDDNERMRVNRLVDENRIIMNRRFDKIKDEEKKNSQLLRLQMKMNEKRL